VCSHLTSLSEAFAAHLTAERLLTAATTQIKGGGKTKKGFKNIEAI
jgi:hypothetical protein